MGAFRHIFHRPLPVIGLLLTWLTCAPHASATPTYVLHDLYPLNSGFQQATFNPIANAQAVGTRNTSPIPLSYTWHPIIYSAGAEVDLLPTGLGWTQAILSGTNGFQQVGSVYGPVNGGYAALWNGTAASAVNLHPTQLGFITSLAVATNGTHQVGSGVSSSGSQSHALLWSGSANSAVDLNPINLPNFSSSNARGVAGAQQVGSGEFSAGNVTTLHPLLWTGTAASAVDLYPVTLTGITSSEAYATDGIRQVGVAQFGSPANGTLHTHAVRWSGTAASVIDLNPAGILDSYAWAISGVNQVGEIAAPDGKSHAALWTGGASSFVDLQSFLPANLLSSEAFSVDSAGNIFGIAMDSSGVQHAVEWSVPEPTAMVWLPLLALIARRPKRSAPQILAQNLRPPTPPAH